ncbi:MFS transporter [Paractinoplanes lichenicola]|uniref:MFS transporter n=1 Tax=Paractinoplanes lichenicola TaxID=2802976 RepID=A0ABS1VS68_9ACTN|nr:MFS transporter [Actinoplanes lichenicola]MBL7257406.1 MFS transporter [Actinoplanes lichenicola]
MENLTAGRRWAALLALALGGFGLGLTEFVAMGLLPDLARDLLPAAYARSAPDAMATAGWMITSYALGVVVGAPTIAALTARMPRRRLVLGLLALFLVGTVASALAPTFGLVLTGRFVAALAHGAYFGAAGLLASSMLGPGSQARGFAVVLSGLTAANVFGVPLITSLGQAAGWRIAYLAVAGVFALTLLFVLFTVPEVAAAAGGSPRAELGAFRSPQVWLAAAVAAIGFGGFFAVNSYIAPVTTHVTGLPESYVPWVLAVMGVGMTVGNALGGIAADRNLRRSILLGFAAMIATVALFGVVARNPVGLFAAAFLVGAAALFIGPALQARLIAVAPGAQLMGAAVNQSASNIANSAGAALGGITIAAGWGYLSAAWIGVLLAGTGLLLAVLSFRLDRRAPLPGDATRLEPAAA